MSCIEETCQDRRDVDFFESDRGQLDTGKVFVQPVFKCSEEKLF
jgi:hypothetical protein